MNSKSDLNFLFTVCQVGAESTLKKELAREYPAFTFAYSRPGFVTFKRSDGTVPLNFSLRSIFARAYGVSLGEAKLPSLDSILAFARELAQTQAETQGGKKLKLHVWEREFHASNEEPMGFVSGALLGDLEQRIRAAAPGLFDEVVEAKTDDLVLDVILLEKDRAWVGAHAHSVFHSPWPGARMPTILPADSPSRAYLKIEECISWSGALIKPGDTAVEIGSAPGGASFALLNRGLRVVGIDPAEMHPRIMRNPKFQHIRKPVGGVPREDLPESIQWLLLDMNVEPRISLFQVDRLASRMLPTLQGVFLTIKLNQWKIADEIPSMMEHVKAIGMVRTKAAQLPNHRQEIVIFGLTRKGLSRQL